MRWWARVWALCAVGCVPVAAPPQPPPAPVAATAPRGALAASGSATPPDAALPEAEHAPDVAYETEDDAPADEVDLGEPAAAAPAPPREHPLDDVAPDELARRVREDVAALGSISIGKPSAGGLLNGVQMPTGDHWVLVDPAHAWGTRETIDYLVASIEAVHAEHSGAHPLYIGHISARGGGALSPHISHQAGRDVDISYFYSDEKSARWYARAHAGNLDRARTWAFVRALVSKTDVELILIDHSIQALLREHALAIGEDPGWVTSLFRGKPGELRPLIVHAKGHATHLHVRFYNPIAQETARRTYELLIREGKVKPPTRFVQHKVKKGETLGMLARKYGSSVAAIRRANGLRSTLIVAGRTYRIPKRTGVPRPARVVVPSRRLPPPATGAASGAAHAGPAP